MSIESVLHNLEEYHEAWGRGDQEAGMAFYSDDVIVHMGGNGPLAGVYRGKKDFVDNWVGRINAYVDHWQVGEEGVDDKDTIMLVGEDGVLMLVHEEWSKGDRKVITKRMGFYRWEDAKIVECYFADMNQPEVEGFFGEL